MSGAEFYTEINISNNTHSNWRRWNKLCEDHIYSALTDSSQSNLLYSDPCLLFPRRYVFPVRTNKNLSGKTKPNQPLLPFPTSTSCEVKVVVIQPIPSAIQSLHCFAMHLPSNTNLPSRSRSLLMLWVALTQLVILVSVRFLECIVSTQWDWGFQNGTWRI